MQTFSATVLFLDGQPDSENEFFDSDTIVLPNETEELSVRENFDPGKPIGTATLRREGDCVIADMKIDPEFDAHGRYPSVCGYLPTAIEEGPHHEPYALKNARIVSIGICADENSDSRIGPIVTRNEKPPRVVAPEPDHA